MIDRLISELRCRDPTEVADVTTPQAAVSLLLAPDPDQLLLILRAVRSGDPWSGQLALPGGRRQESDRSLLETAMRETAEETSIHLDPKWLALQLDDLAPVTPTLPPIVVRPFVFRLPRALPGGVSTEVARSIWLPLSHLAADGTYVEREIEVHGAVRTVGGYAMDEGFLWGMTARIVSPIVLLWKSLDDSGRGLEGATGR